MRAATGSRSCSSDTARCTTPTAWTRADDGSLRRQRFQSGPLTIVFDECYGRMLDAKARRDALDTSIAELAATPPRRCRPAARLPAGRLHADDVRVVGR